jgi:hypothetical protein
MPISKSRLERNREEGKRHEENFCKLMHTLGYWTYRYQEFKTAESVALKKGEETIILPDVWLVKSPTFEFYAEVKGKSPTHGYYAPIDCFGLEEYRLKSALRLADLVTARVMYVIFNKEDKEWIWNEFRTLAKRIHETRIGDSYVAGEVKEVPICYWKKEEFTPLVKDGKLNVPKT